ncbi:DUF72 domain-containing protein [Flavobacterium foetidum]|uniref:DUF72 domain-containing protein n=1 Tax=Flavobacterium foetidum TaxID=2026681 RepID=UPI001074F790|nr:DUF72 domain-containing protein [Flavobacterium foetidum]KAF2508099.1 DUF72 domain-containing protein [Flavobacterium foetidum]
MKNHSLHIGTSGWSYKHWRNTFYPEKLKVKDQFSYYVSKFNTVEINNTFYGLPSDETFLKWKNSVPEDFVYAIKANRFITHIKKLHDPRESLELFLEKLAILDQKLGVILVQLPPTLHINIDLLEDFLQALPQNQRFVFEFRHASWYSDPIYVLLKNYNAAFCIYELAGHTSPIKITADFIYLRLHGPSSSKYQGSYSDQILTDWAEQCIEWLKTKDVFVYFDNDEKAYAAFNALRLEEFINKIKMNK